MNESTTNHKEQSLIGGQLLGKVRIQYEKVGRKKQVACGVMTMCW